MNSEILLLPHIKKILNDDTIYNSKNKYSVFDYYSKKLIKCELKTRNLYSYSHKTTMISQHKIYHCNNPKCQYYFFFEFKDCLKYIKYEKEIFDKYEKKIGGRCDRGKEEYSQYVYIPISECETYIIN